MKHHQNWCTPTILSHCRHHCRLHCTICTSHNTENDRAFMKQRWIIEKSNKNCDSNFNRNIGKYFVCLHSHQTYYKCWNVRMVFRHQENVVFTLCWIRGFITYATVRLLLLSQSQERHNFLSLFVCIFIVAFCKAFPPIRFGCRVLMRIFVIILVVIAVRPWFLRCYFVSVTSFQPLADHVDKIITQLCAFSLM